MILSLLLYAGLGVTALGVLNRSWRGTLAGLIASAVALGWPPEREFSERHTAHVDAPPERVFDATHAVTAEEILFFRTLTTIRRFGRPGRADILNPPAAKPILDVATRSTFQLLTNDRPHEIVIGTCVAPGVNAVMNFLITPDGRGGSNISTETRVFASTAVAARKFALYWRAILPGSDIIRRSWLRAIKRRAES